MVALGLKGSMGSSAEAESLLLIKQINCCCVVLSTMVLVGVIVSTDCFSPLSLNQFSNQTGLGGTLQGTRGATVAVACEGQRVWQTAEVSNQSGGGTHFLSVFC